MTIITAQTRHAKRKAQMRARARERYLERKAAGRCCDCGDPSPLGRVRCATCQSEATVISNECARRKRRERGAKPRRKRPERSRRQQDHVAEQPPEARELPTKLRAVLAAAFPNPKPGALAYRVMYDPSVAANCNKQSNDEQTKEPIPPSREEDAWHQASFFVARCDKVGRAVPGVEFRDSGKTATSTVLPEFAKGDRGQRYVVTAYDPVLEKRFTFGWTDLPAELIWQVQRHARFTNTRVVDRKPPKT